MAEADRPGLGIDVGGTKTRLIGRLGSGEGIDRTVESRAWRTDPFDAKSDASGLAELIRDALGTSPFRVPVVIGAHGYDTSAACRELEHELSELGIAPILVLNDSELMPLAMGSEGAIGMVAGTGAIVTARDSAGELVSCGGWGWLLGDEGSAPGIVRESLKASLAALDAGAEPESDPLIPTLLHAFAAHDASSLGLAATASASASSWGALVTRVFDAARAGSRLARGVIDEAGASLAASVAKLVQRGVTPSGVVAGGSVIENQPLLQDALRAAMERQCPYMSLKVLDQPPALGAFRRAQQLSNRTTTTVSEGRRRP